jgi:hypothetical protein
MTMEATTPRTSSARKRSRSVPRGTNYYAHIDAAHSRRSRPVDDNMAFTVYDARISSRALISILRAEAMKHNLDVSDLVLERFCQILSNTDASRERMMILRMVLVLPMQVSNADLERISRLDVPDRKLYFQQGRMSRKHAFYIRPWTMTPMQLYNFPGACKKTGWPSMSSTGGNTLVTWQRIDRSRCDTLDAQNV